MAYRTDLPPDNVEWQRSAQLDGRRQSPVNPQAHDNVADERPLLYGPRGEVLMRQERRRVGFRKP